MSYQISNHFPTSIFYRIQDRFLLVNHCQYFLNVFQTGLTEIRNQADFLSDKRRPRQFWPNRWLDTLNFLVYKSFLCESILASTCTYLVFRFSRLQHIVNEAFVVLKPLILVFFSSSKSTFHHHQLQIRSVHRVSCTHEGSLDTNYVTTKTRCNG